MSVKAALAFATLLVASTFASDVNAEPPLAPATMDIIERVPPAKANLVALEDAREMFKAGLGMVLFQDKEGGHAAVTLAPNFQPGCEVKLKLVF